ncbi:uncharacterized protein PITG_02381 [Phytophthora infestans T30-4]|uniref:Uncharacterized protein n=1 Tax=Phytophthora infestans (strain T30-4) TaxID=403677 RepID=D0MW69_PHYIT|nr:uncharacterized protein PITG_02381 [Phytophthora infestans T30-4]EEY63882.1 conserved hypothetical protein [Phytophthora infestans T30-4]|eukprot:XP_002907318.1 conserved hypothetical protein [Phytophthora infestans T30-4]
MQTKRYKSILIEFMAFKAGHPFSTDTVFSKSDLLEVTPDVVCRWMNMRAFGEETPTEDAKPVNTKASTLEYAKKALSSFMPRRTVPWDPICNEGNPTRSESVYAVIKKDIFEGPDFHKLKPGNLGTHCLRKGAATYGSRSGLPKDYVNRRGRWRTRKSVVDVYIDNTQPYMDGVAAGALTGPLGPCCYVLKKGIHAVTEELLVKQVGPAIKEAMGEEVVKVLALPLLWASLVPDGSFDYDLLPSVLKQRIVRAYINAGENVAVNPVERVPLHVTGDGAQLRLVDIRDTPTDGNESEQTHGTQSNMSADSTRKDLS